jgi:2-iminobutanoate/2-iminopropanoate deaminase
MTLKYPMAKGQEKHVLPLSSWRHHGDTIYFSGAGAVDENGAFVGDTLEVQMRYTMERFEKTLAAAGVTFADIIQVRAYVQNPVDIPLYNRLYRDYFRDPFPARTTIVNCLPPGLLFEIDAVAIASPEV